MKPQKFITPNLYKEKKNIINYKEQPIFQAHDRLGFKFYSKSDFRFSEKHTIRKFKFLRISPRYKVQNSRFTST